MNKTKILMGCLVLIGCCGGNAADVTEQEVKAQIIAQEKAWSDAVIRHDAEKISLILADDFIGIDGRGVITDKTAELKEAKPPPAGDSAVPQLLKEEFSDITARAIRKYCGSYSYEYRSIFLERKGNADQVSTHHGYGCATRAAGAACPFTAAAFSSHQNTKQKVDCDWIDIREMDLPLCDAGPKFRSGVAAQEYP
jgi:hypothetical protein